MKYGVGILMIAVMLAATLIGCDNKSKIIRKGFEDMDKHAKEIEKAGEPIGPERAAP